MPMSLSAFLRKVSIWHCDTVSEINAVLPALSLFMILLIASGWYVLTTKLDTPAIVIGGPLGVLVLQYTLEFGLIHGFRTAASVVCVPSLFFRNFFFSDLFRF